MATLESVSEVAGRSRVFSAGWIAVSALTAVGIVGTWLIYTIPGFCWATYPSDCSADPRLLPATVGTVVLVVLWVVGSVVRLRSAAVVWSRLFAILFAAAAVVVPAVTLDAVGFMIPWW